MKQLVINPTPSNGEGYLISPSQLPTKKKKAGKRCTTKYIPPKKKQLRMKQLKNVFVWKIDKKFAKYMEYCWLWLSLFWLFCS